MLMQMLHHHLLTLTLMHRHHLMMLMQKIHDAGYRNDDYYEYYDDPLFPHYDHYYRY
jgi:hypothetical protein